MSRYLYILASHPPADVGMDNLNRVQFSTNFYACAEYPVVDWILDVAKILTEEGVLTTLNTDYFIGSNKSLPNGVGPFTLLLNTGGLGSTITHDNQRLTKLKCQIIVHGGNYATAHTKAINIWKELDGLYNRTVTL